MGLRAAKLLDKAVLVAAGVALAGKANGVPSTQFWNAVVAAQPYLPVVLLVIAGIFGALTPFEWWHQRTLADRKTTMRRRILTSFGRMLEVGSRVEPPLRTGDLALHFWKVQRTWRHPVSGVLRRLSTYRMSSSPQTRTFAPPRGVGAVGLCWSHNREVKVDASRLDELKSENEFTAYRQAHGSESVMNLDWTTFQQVRHRKALFAVPIRNAQSRFIGCISLDAGHGFDVLERSSVVEEMNALSTTMSRDDFDLV
ncbi:hypothetical protein JOD54_000604 [Actinokineospora baliensis]|uniref:hypothetical protein n=1 Tax=Actinokineospora baliensis TaxID=547056 RepID=UPI001959A295|nr:hypothetical protein [Actinokineospora baliensis]MBM7770400.1 hypothetical protein [Actinokineospora baliensis]